jgi:excinuclease UvrABC nuclease subunit
MKSYTVLFQGYRRDENTSSLPTYSGVYMVYRCVYDSQSNTVSLKELIYIGQAQNIHDRIANHDKRQVFERELRTGEELCYAYAEVPKKDLDIIENALVFSQKPRLNETLKDRFNHGSASFSFEGKNALLEYTDFSIK